MPWGSRGDLPTDLELWLGGLDVGVVANPPRRPQANGVVERSQGTGKRWSDPAGCGSVEELRRRLEELDCWQRERYPYAGGMSRLEAHPGLRHSGRAYDPAAEEACWSRPGAWGVLGAVAVPRRVSPQGKVSLYERPLHVGVGWAGRTVWVGFDDQAGRWTVQDERGMEIRRAEPVNLDERSIRELDVSCRRRGAHATKPGRRRTDGDEPACR